MKTKRNWKTLDNLYLISHWKSEKTAQIVGRLNLKTKKPFIGHQPQDYMYIKYVYSELTYLQFMCN